MKKIQWKFGILLVTVLLSISILGCKARKPNLSDKVQILCTTFPQYDWTMNIIGENFNSTVLSLLIKNGVDMHSYQPSIDDIVTISSCNLLIYTGGESEQWIRDALEKPECQNVRSICLMDLLTEKLEEDKTEDDEETEYDEHVWLSIRNAELFCTEIEKVLEEMDAPNKDNYKNHLESYLKELDSLDKQYVSTIASAPVKTIIVCDRFPFKYLTADYNLSYYAAFPGCSSEITASTATISNLAKKLDENKLKGVFKIDNSKDDLCRTVISSSKQALCDILTLNSMQSTTLRDSYKENTYISIMKDNLDQLRKALY